MPKLLYLVTEDWFFCRHFLPMAHAARQTGFDVVVATRLREHRAIIEREGYRVVPFETDRRGVGLIDIVRDIWRVRRIVQNEAPDVVHCIALRMVIVGGLAARLARLGALILAPTGLGHLWIEKGVREGVGRALIRFLVRYVFRGERTYFLFENADDPIELGLDPNAPDVTLVGGAGVEPEQFQVLPEPSGPPIKVAVVARMLKAKGIAESVAAICLARARGADVELHLFGEPDLSNPSSFTENELRTFEKNRGVIWHGSATDVAEVWRTHHIAMLLSRREGLPRSLVEAAMAGRPIITTDVPGCRELVRDIPSVTLIPCGESIAAADVIIKLSNDAHMRHEWASAIRARSLRYFTRASVERVVTALYSLMKEERAQEGPSS